MRAPQTLLMMVIIGRCDPITEIQTKTYLIYVQMALLRAKFSETSKRYDEKKTIEVYQSVVDLNPKSEESHFRLARYIDVGIETAKPQNEYVWIFL